MELKINTKTGILILVIILGIVCVTIAFVLKQIKTTPPFIVSLPSFTQKVSAKVVPFSSQEDFKLYLKNSELAYGGAEFALGPTQRAIPIEEGVPTLRAEKTAPSTFPSQKLPERVSQTTVQVLSIDEPDIVKTNGKEIFFSQKRGYYYPVFREREILPPKPSFLREGLTRIIKAFPPADLKLESSIKKGGNLLLQGDILMIFTPDKVYGYDVSQPDDPIKKWTIEFNKSTSLVDARLYKKRLYLITKQKIYAPQPCPIRPLKIENKTLVIRCPQIYHPVTPLPVDITFTILEIDPLTGKKINSLAFVGSSGKSVVYMSENAIYITYSYVGDFVDFFYKFLKSELHDIVPQWVLEKIKKLKDYDISQQAKYIETGILFEKMLNSLSGDERLKLENELSNRAKEYLAEHQRELQKTGIVKISLQKFQIKGVGEVPGVPLNQFSLDEYQNFLRVAVTVGGRVLGGFLGFGTLTESVNDIYVLDHKMKMVGALKNIGVRERIYAVRFIGEKGYLVTFRRTDPFFVLDLSDPKNPLLKGELKIPGYSSFLHPIERNRILGIGKEGSQVKISLFDVEDPEHPKEIEKYILKEYWSDILNTHHAFLLDKKHKVFFLPGSRGGYIFSFRNDRLKMIKAISNLRAKRAVYIDDYLYVIGEEKIVVLNEIDWQRVNELDLREYK